MLTADQRSQVARERALRQHARGRTNTAPARAAFDARFEKIVDPDGVLEPAERAKRAERERKAHFIALGRASAKARRDGRKCS